jgi:PPOX class probable F420-dependent enzyme
VNRYREPFAAARVAVLATLTPDGAPHLVPVTFALDGDVLWTATDAKPKRPGPLARHRNIAADPRVSVLVQHFDEDWSQLWWVRADGVARIVAETGPAIAALRAKYPQYAEVALGRPVIEVRVTGWRGWP